MITIEAILDSYLYINESTGYCVASLSNGIKAVGILINIKPGEKLKLTGEYETHPKYGMQFRIDSYSIVIPSTKTGLAKYLSSGMIKGIGPVTAEKIIEQFEDTTIDVLDNNIDRLLEIEGIGSKKLEQIKKSWGEQKAVKEIIIYLQGFDISPAYAVKIYKVYGINSIKVIQNNPYQLTYDVWGIGFKIADSIGKNVGFSDDHPKRIKAGIVYILNEAASDGHVYLTSDELNKKCFDMLGIDLSDSLLLMREMQEENLIYIVQEKVYLAHLYEAEKYIEHKIKLLAAGESKFTEKELKLIRLNLDLSEEQSDAVRKSLTNKIMILTGGPGTGKTTTLKGIIDSYKQLKKNILLAAPTGRAAKRMSEVIGMEAKTLHRLLEFNPQDQFFQRGEDNPLEADLLVIDEVSMIDTLLMNSMLSAVNPETTLILVGDVDQLPSVGSGNILNDLILSGIIPIVKLTKIFRQAEKSSIVVNAHKINNGELPSINNNEEADFFFIQESDNSKIADLIIELCSSRLPDKYGFDPVKDIQVLTPMYKGEVGVNNLNIRLQEVLNQRKVAHNRGEKNYKIGDKVMQLKNNYDKEVYNGDIGIIESVDNEDQIMEINFSGKNVQYEFAELEDITLAYAITVHKSQGSEYPCVILPISAAHFIMLQRNLLYTAITRASQMLILVGTRQALAIAVGNKKTKRRNTSLFSDN